MTHAEERWAERCRALGFERQERPALLGVTFVEWAREGDATPITLHGPPSQFAEGHVASVVLKLGLPLRCGLRARSDGPPAPDETPQGAREPLEVDEIEGLEALASWSVEAVDHTRATMLMVALAADLQATSAGQPKGRLQLDDDALSLAFPMLPKTTTLARAVDDLLALGRRVAAVRDGSGPPTWTQCVLTAWRDAAEDGDRIDEEALSFTGRRPGLSFELKAHLDLHDGRPHLSLTGEPERSGFAPLRVMRSSSANGFGMFSKMLGFVIAKTGDDAFDERFSVCGSSREAALVPMTSDVRARLCGLPTSVFQVDAAEGQVQVATDDSLDVDQLRQLLADLSALLEELPDRTQIEESEGGGDLRRVVWAVAVVVAVVVAALMAR